MARPLPPQPVARRQLKAPDIGLDPGQVGARHLSNAGHAQLLLLALLGVHEVATRIGVGMGTAPGYPRPLRRRPGPEQAKIKGAAVRGLEVVDPLEAGAAQAPAQGHPGTHPKGRRAGVDPHLVEPTAGLGERGARRRRQERDVSICGICMVPADGREGTDGLRKIAECTELDDEDTGRRRLDHQAGDSIDSTSL